MAEVTKLHTASPDRNADLSVDFELLTLATRLGEARSALDLGRRAVTQAVAAIEAAEVSFVKLRTLLKG